MKILILFLLAISPTASPFAFAEDPICAEWPEERKRLKDQEDKIEGDKTKQANRYNTQGVNNAKAATPTGSRKQVESTSTARDLHSANAQNAAECLKGMQPIVGDAMKQKLAVANARDKFGTCKEAQNDLNLLDNSSHSLYERSNGLLNRCNGQGFRAQKLAKETGNSTDKLGKDGTQGGQQNGGQGEQQKKDDKGGGSGGGSPGGGAPPEQKPEDPKKDAQEAPCPQGFEKNKDKLCEPAQNKVVEQETARLRDEQQQKLLLLQQQEINRLKEQKDLEIYNQNHSR